MDAVKTLLVLALLAMAVFAVGCNEEYASEGQSVQWRSTGTGWFGPDVAYSHTDNH